MMMMMMMIMQRDILHLRCRKLIWKLYKLTWEINVEELQTDRKNNEQNDSIGNSSLLIIM